MPDAPAKKRFSIHQRIAENVTLPFAPNCAMHESHIFVQEAVNRIRSVESKLF